MVGNQTLSVGAGGYVAAEELRSLSTRDWIAWLRARTREYDAYTAQRLSGVSDRMGVVRESVLRAEEPIQEACVEASWALARELLLLFFAAESGEQAHQLAAALSDTLGLLTSLPYQLISRSPSRDNSITQLASFATGPVRAEEAGPALDARAAALRLLLHTRAPLSWTDLEDLLRHVALCATAARALLGSYPDRAPEVLALAFKTFWDDRSEQLFDYFLSDLAGQGVLPPEQIRRALAGAIAHLDPPLRTSFLTDERVRKFLGPSVVLQRIADRKGSFRFCLRDYIPPWHAFALAVWDEVNRVLRDEFGVSVRFSQDRANRPWDAMVKNARRGRSIPLDPIFMTPSRSDSVVVVPYGVLNSLTVMWIHSDVTTRQLKACATLTNLLRTDITIVSMGLTAADEEVGEIEDDLERELNVEKELSTGEMAHRLFGLWKDGKTMAAAVIDTGFSQELEAEIRKRCEMDMTVRKSGIPDVMAQPMAFRSPVMVGIPAPKEDYLWARVLVGVVERVLYGQHDLANPKSAAAKALATMEIAPFDGSADVVARAWVPVPAFVVPRVSAITHVPQRSETRG